LKKGDGEILRLHLNIIPRRIKTNQLHFEAKVSIKKIIEKIKRINPV
jgi:hypothetical protein